MTEIRLAFCGDVMLGQEVAEHMGPSSVSEWLNGISCGWKDADLLVGNLECPCAGDGEPRTDLPPELTFHTSADRLKQLADAGFAVLTLANNHVLDCGSAGLRETIRGLEDAGIHHTGAGMNLAEALKPAFVPVRGRSVGIVAFSYGPPAGPSAPGAAPCEPRLMRRALRDARRNADFVVAVLHDGLEYCDVPTAKSRARFRFLAGNGADVVVGHHPHVLQGLEWYGGVPIAYSLGDLLFHNSLPHVAQRNFSRIAMGRYAPEEVLRRPDKFGYGAILNITAGSGIIRVEWAPFRQDARLRPQLSTGQSLEQDLDRIHELSELLSDTGDPRHTQAERVAAAVREASRSGVTVREIGRLARRPKLRYLPLGLQWAVRQLFGKPGAFSG